jgi:uncharacterized protein YqgV (UPF0045/DUF77 family)
MIGISAQISLYPLGQNDINPAVQAFIDTLCSEGLECEVGAMSTLVWGDDEQVLSALREAYRAATAFGPAVLHVTLSNACPLPAAPASGAETA